MARFADGERPAPTAARLYVLIVLPEAGSLRVGDKAFRVGDPDPNLLDGLFLVGDTRL